MESKETIRKRLLGMRLVLSMEQVDEMSRLILERLMSSGLLKEAKKVALYASIKNEVKTEEIVRQLRAENRKVFFPRVVGEGLEFAEAKEAGSALAEMDAVLVPGVAFDEEGYRIGMGGGHYDRAVRTFRGVKIGLAYDFQILEAFPRENHDLRCDWIVTEKRVIQGTH